MNRFGLLACCFVISNLTGCSTEDDPPIGTGSSTSDSSASGTSFTTGTATTNGEEGTTGDGDSGDGDSGDGDSGDGDSGDGDSGDGDSGDGDSGDGDSGDGDSGDGDTGDGDTGDGDSGDGDGECSGETPDACGNLCTNLDSDESNCGTCGISCETDEVCLGGDCYYERTWGMSNNIETLANDAFFPRVGIDEVGNATVAWYRFGGTAFDLYAQRYDYGTDMWGAPLLLETSDAGDAFGHQVAVSSNGDAMVAWLQSDGANQSGYYNRYDAGTDSWSGAQTFETSNESVDSVHVDLNDAGDALVVFIQNDGGVASVWANRYDEGTAAWTGAAPIESLGGGASQPFVRFGSNGDAFAVWTQESLPNTNVLAARFDGGTETWGSETSIDSAPGVAARPRVDVDASGNALAAWQHAETLYSDIVTNYYTAGSGWNPTHTLVDNQGVGDAQAPVVALAEDGTGVVAWYHLDNGTSNVHANLYSAGSWSGDELIESNDDGDALEVSAAVDDAGNFAVLWRQFALGEQSIYAQHWQAPAQAWLDEPVLIEDEATLCKQPDLAMNGNGDAVAVWLQDDMGDDSVFANRYR